MSNQKKPIAIAFVAVCLIIRATNLVGKKPHWLTKNNPLYYANFEDGIFLLQHEKDPYGLPGMYQKPVFFFAVSKIHNIEYG